MLVSKILFLLLIYFLTDNFCSTVSGFLVITFWLIIFWSSNFLVFLFNYILERAFNEKKILIFFKIIIECSSNHSNYCNNATIDKFGNN